MNNSTFKYNYTGLYTSDQYVFIKNSFFNHNANFGWQATDIQANCDVTNSNFNYNGMAGISFSSQANSTLSLKECNLINNAQNGVEIFSATLQSRCSYFQYNHAGIYAGIKSVIAIANESKNTITHNYFGILFNNALYIDLSNGYNNFSSNNYYLIGQMLPNYYYNPNSSPNPVDVDYNLMPATSGTTLPINMYFYDIQNSAAYTIHIIGWNTNISSISCKCVSEPIDAVNYDNYKMFEGKISTAVISTSHFPNTYLIDAIKGAAQQMSYGKEYIGNDTLAIAMFKEIFDTIPPSINKDEDRAISQGLKLMLTALTNAIERGLIEPDRALDGMPVDEYVGMIGEEIQRRLNDLEYSDIYYSEQKAYYKLLMAQMFRAAEHYDYALNILQNDNNFYNTKLQNEAEYWSCVCNAENQLLKGNIERSVYQKKIDSCRENSNARKAMFMPILGETEASINESENQVIGVYPNPAESLIAVEFSISVDDVQVELSDFSGKIVWHTAKKVGGKQLRLKLPKLSSGAYMLKTITEKQVFNNKIIIR